MNKETLRMQMLAGIITEGQYKNQLNENPTSQEWIVEEVEWNGDESHPEITLIKLTNGDKLVSTPEPHSVSSSGVIDIIGYTLKPGDKISFDHSPTELGEIPTNVIFINDIEYEIDPNDGYIGADLMLVK